MVREPEPHYERAQHVAEDDGGAPADGGVDALRLPQAAAVQRLEIEVREDEGDEEERRRAGEEVARRDEIAGEHLRRLLFDDLVAGASYASGSAMTLLLPPCRSP